MPSAAWVVGAGGLLGSSVVRVFPQFLPGVGSWTPEARKFSWKDPPTLDAEFGAATRAYVNALPPDSPWMILWCAGAGVVGTPAADLARETQALEVFLGHLGTAAGPRPGAFFLAGSAGGLHGGSTDLPLTEHTAPCPISDYGRAKLRQEEILAGWAAERPGVSTLVGRISNLYGPEQNLAKPQGLIAHLSRCLLHHVPAHVFAPLDTLRDHDYAPDAAAQILRCMDRLARLAPPARVTKLISSGQTATIGAILAIFSRIAKRQPRIICSGTPVGSIQPSRLALRSDVWTDLAPVPPTPLAVGIHAVYSHHLRLFQAGRLPPPAARTA